jgi:leucyl-tRNA synthetase
MNDQSQTAADPKAYNPAAIEPKWQAQWEQKKSHEVRDDLPREKCYYVLEMFPYPSGKLHMGHVRNYTIGDAVARYKRMRGFHVLHPMGWDSFGLPAEQAAIERGAHPKTWTYANIDYMRAQLKRMGFSYAWSREFACSDPGYAAREQDIFLDLVEKGLVYRKSSLVNWSTGLDTVLANEQVIDGKCWRTGMPVIQKELAQWYLRITDYAEELLQNTQQLPGWPEAVLTQQRNWIGKSRGAEIDFAIDGHPGRKLTVFTTRPDTLFGVTFVTVAPEHALVAEITPASHQAAVTAFAAEVRAKSAHDRIGEAAEKKGVFSGAYAIHPVSGVRVPIWLANFVVADYGTGAVMAVPAHDDRDFAFAKVYNLAVVQVIAPAKNADQGESAAVPTQMEAAYTDAGVMINSGEFDGFPSEEAKGKITEWLEKNGKGRGTTTWKLRDWGISRQRYWGNPIPFVYGERTGVTPVRKQDLPVALPVDVTFDGRGNPLEKHKTWATTNADGSPLTIRTADGMEPARRETDTMDTFMESSWYFARFTCPDAAKPLDRVRVDHWLPVDLYIGGIEHAVLHLLYARFFTKALADLGYTRHREPFKRLLCQGMVVMETYYREGEGGKKHYFSPDDVTVTKDAKGKVISAVSNKDGNPVTVGRIEKMSKSKLNGVDPQQLINEYGADTARLFALFAAPPERDLEWNEAGVEGCKRFLKRLWTLAQNQQQVLSVATPFAGNARDLTGPDQAVVRKIHATIAKATDAMEKDFAFNTTIAACMELSNELNPEVLRPDVLKLGVTTLIRLLAPMVPHICAELWEQVGGSPGVPTGDLTAAGWPTFDPAQIQAADTDYPVQINGKVRGRVSLATILEGAALDDAVKTHPEVVALVAGKPIRKLIVVRHKIINIVV